MMFTLPQWNCHVLSYVNTSKFEIEAAFDKKNCSVIEALQELRETITKFAPQGPRV